MCGWLQSNKYTAEQLSIRVVTQLSRYNIVSRSTVTNLLFALQIQTCYRIKIIYSKVNWEVHYCKIQRYIFEAQGCGDSGTHQVIRNLFVNPVKYSQDPIHYAFVFTGISPCNIINIVLSSHRMAGKLLESFHSIKMAVAFSERLFASFEAVVLDRRLCHSFLTMCH